ncbi:MAG: AAA family ATPase [Lentisphaeraceae bacterium]|nr:AAA family ATPase [Lentisphaeraceae bacterium]
MNKNELALKWCEEHLREGMYEGNMHLCLRDIGRLVGGYEAAGYLDPSAISHLENIAFDFSINKQHGLNKFKEAIDHGRKSPMTIEDRERFDTQNHEALSWDSTIGEKKELKVVDTNWIQDLELPPCSKNWQPMEDLKRYLLTLFRPDDFIGYVSGEVFQPEGTDKWLPSKGSYSRNLGELFDELKNSGNDFGAVFGDYKEAAGAWCRVNPLDGKGVKDANVTEYRYALIESDECSLERQYAILNELELPIATLVHSGKKSLHALVKVDADTFDEYRKRVDFLYDVCQKNGLKIDRANRNPSRLSRLPGVTRNGKPQYLIATNIGQASWNEWKDWIEELNDDLPDIQNLDEVFNDPPPLADELIKGILRQGHKLMIAGPSKAGKSFNLMQLTIAIAEGAEWNGWKCQQGSILYLNLEVDKPSCIDRLRKVYKAMGLEPNNVSNIDIWHLRGKSAPMDKLAPKLIRRAAKKKYTAVIIDPIYKVITGDENSADQMAAFCNQFDKIAHELGAAVIYCHHHSKGSQGGKRAQDRSSGSGVFARDPDAILDLIELEIDKDRRKQLENITLCRVIAEYLDKKFNNWRHKVPQDSFVIAREMITEAESLLGNTTEFPKFLFETRQAVEAMTAWRIEGTLREFPRFPVKKMWFDYPIHRPDVEGLLIDAVAEGEEKPFKKMTKEEKQAKQDSKKSEQNLAIENAFSFCDSGEEPVYLKDIQEHLGHGNDRTTRRHVNDHPDFEIVKGIVRRAVK